MTIWILSIYAVIVTIVCLAFHKLWSSAHSALIDSVTINDNSKVAELLVKNAQLQGELARQKMANTSGKINAALKPAVDYEAMFVQVNAEKMTALRQAAYYKRLQEGQCFSGDEINSLISLCHPDKHGGKDSAHRMTQRLLELRH